MVTSPLTKLWRTTEGVILIAANIALVVIPLLTSSLSPDQAVKWGGILDSVAFASRSLLKATAAGKAPAMVQIPESAAKPDTLPAAAPDPEPAS